MKRWQAAVLVGLIVSLVFAVPILAFFSTQGVRTSSARTWVAVLIPNVMLLVLVGVIAAGIYLLVARLSARR